MLWLTPTAGMGTEEYWRQTPPAELSTKADILHNEALQHAFEPHSPALDTEIHTLTARELTYICEHGHDIKGDLAASEDAIA